MRLSPRPGPGGRRAVVGQRAPDGAGPYVQVADSRAALAPHGGGLLRLAGPGR